MKVQRGLFLAVGIVFVAAGGLTVRSVCQSREPHRPGTQMPGPASEKPITEEKSIAEEEPVAEDPTAATVDALAEVSLLEWQNDANLLKARVPKLYKRLSVKPIPTIEESLWLYRAQCLLALGRNKEARKIVQGRLEKGTDKPDFLLLELRFVGGDRQTLEDRITIWNELGRIVPLSLWGNGRDARMRPAFAKPNPPVPSVPDTYDIQGILAEIARSYEEQDLIKDALNVYLEALYGGPLSGYEERRGGLWLKVAEIERTRGNKKLAVGAYLRAVRTWYELADTVKEGIKQTLAETEPPKTTDGKPILTKDTAIEIAALYLKLNLHPLALAVLKECEGDTGAELTAETQMTRTEWEQILGRITQVRGADCYVLGHKVSEVQDWSSIQILRPTDTFWKQ
jgi:tetratricopeptide (TPR) repeat protein